MKKTLTKIIAAALTAAAMLSPMSSNAIYQVTHVEDGEILKIVEHYMKVYSRAENVHFLDWATSNGTTMPGYEYVYVNENGDRFMAFRKIDGIDVAVELAEGVEREDVEKALHEQFAKDWVDVMFSLYGDTNRYYVVRHSPFGYPTVNEAVEWLDFLKEQGLIISGKIYTEIYSIYDFYGGGVNYYSYSKEKNEQISSFVENELEGYNVEVCFKEDDDHSLWMISSQYINVIPPENATLAEQIEAAEMIYEATGEAPVYGSPEDAKSNADGGCIDVYNAVKGDANLDGRVTVADAVAILQSIGNNDKYPLSRQGSFNGDMVGDYDGITAADALAIQQLDTQSKL